MDWFQPKRRGPQWKQGWTEQTLTSITTSTPPLPLLAIFGIVIFLLSLSPYTDYKSRLHQSANNLQIFLILLPLLLILFMVSYSTNWLLYFRLRNPQQGSVQRAGSAGSSPWGIAIFVLLLLMLLYYQSYFHSQWFGPLRRSD